MTKKPIEWVTQPYITEPNKVSTLQEELETIEKDYPLATKYIAELQQQSREAQKLSITLDVLISKMKG